MYQGVLRDEERVRNKAASLLTLSTPSTLSSQSTSTSTPLSAPTKSYSSPLNTPSSPIQQPAPVIDEDCKSCIISPPPPLLEAQSADERAREREERRLEYEAQRNLGDKLAGEQGVEGGRDV